MATILVVSPDLRALQAARQALAQRGYVVVYEYSGAGGLSALETVQVDVICFDRAVTDMTPAEFCKQLRSGPNHKQIPMIFLLSSTGPSTKAPSYVRQGLDTYLTRPFRAAELVERVSAVLEDRVASMERRDQKVLRAGPLVLDDESQGLKVGGIEVGITPTEFRLIWYLAERAGVNPVREFFLLWVLGMDLPGAITIRPADGEAWPPDSH
ncbi:MAG: response regulator, partial [Chloroflexi bacterium]|nr:response regulator [Chloroflexota bacterium]